MIRLLGVDLPKNKRVEYALTHIYGIGFKSAQGIVLNSNISPDRRIDDLTVEETSLLRSQIELINLKLEGDLKRFNDLNLKRLSDINCYRGLRHRANLPSRGQRTRTNARSRRGSKKTVSSKKK